MSIRVHCKIYSATNKKIRRKLWNIFQRESNIKQFDQLNKLGIKTPSIALYKIFRNISTLQKQTISIETYLETFYFNKSLSN